MAIGPDGFRHSQVLGVVAAAATFHLTEPQAREIVDHQIAVIESEWEDVCERAELTEIDRRSFWRRAFLNPYTLEGYRRPS